MQRKQQPLSLTQQPVNTEEFLKQKEEDVAVDAENADMEAIAAE